MGTAAENLLLANEGFSLRRLIAVTSKRKSNM